VKSTIEARVDTYAIGALNNGIFCPVVVTVLVKRILLSRESTVSLVERSGPTERVTDQSVRLLSRARTCCRLLFC
jgi:hypothetical protein